MTSAKSKRRSPGSTPAARDLRKRLAAVGRRVSGAIEVARSSAAMLIVRVPGTLHATRAGARGTTNALQTLPDSTLRGFAAGSVGLGAGFYLAGAPRLAVAAGVAPALIMGAAIVLRPHESVVTAEPDR